MQRIQIAPGSRSSQSYWALCRLGKDQHGRLFGTSSPTTRAATRRPCLTPLAAIFLSLLCLPLTAQVNTESYRPSGSDKGVTGNASLTLAARSGNSETERAGLGFRLFKATPFDLAVAEQADRPVEPPLLSPKRLLMLVAEYDFEEDGGTKFVNRGFAHARYTQMINPRFGWETFVQVETDEFTRLDRRTLLGGGLRYGAYQRRRGTMFLGIGAMGEWERITHQPDTDSGFRDTRNVIRLTSYFNGRWQHSNERVEMSTTTYVQPAIDDTDDYRILSQAQLSTAITQRLALALIVDLRHDSMAPEGVEATDTEIKTALTVSF